ncbi:MAG TPA: hypothetical protein VMQ51_02540 [Candidatus Binatia bacterium]|nr:hypothetical protein [Candidatus Binatia bacterium]
MKIAFLALSLAACASVANTPQQNLAYERWARCGGPSAQLQRLDLDGRITFVAAGAERPRVIECLAEAGRTGPPLPAPVAIAPAGGV